MVLIHIGYSKCASTTLQEIFEQNTSINYTHKPNIFKGKYRDEGIDDKWIKDICKKDMGKPVVVSHEHILLSKTDPIFGISIGGQKEVEETTGLMDSNCDDYNILLIVREQSKMISSRYLQYLMQGGKRKLSDFISLLLPDKNPYEYLDYRFSKVLDILHNSKAKNVICYDVRQINTNGFTDDLTKVLNSKVENVTSERNVAVSKYGANIIRIINACLVTKKETYTEKTQTRVPYIIWLSLVVIVRKVDNLYSRKFGRKDIMNSELKSRIKEIYIDDNKRLNEKYGVNVLVNS